jgi:hypothetical protein
MRLPDFLLIGGMKCGTTSLFFDLGVNPAVFLPDDKEPHDLVSDRVLTPAGKRQYGRLFRGARADQICGEASTGYTKLPDTRGVPRRARRLQGQPRVTSLVREPVSRAVSHHYHLLVNGRVDPDIDRAVRTCSPLIDYGLYAMQIRPWIEELGEDRISIVRFESYVADRRRTVAELSRFLGVEPRTAAIQTDRVRNIGGERRVPAGIGWRFSRGGLYRSWIRPRLPRSVRDRLRRLSMRPAPPRPAPPSPATVDYILDRVGEDVAALQALMGAAGPLWDFDAVRRHYACRD